MEGQIVLTNSEARELVVRISSPAGPFHHVGPEEDLVESLGKLLACMIVLYKLIMSQVAKQR